MVNKIASDPGSFGILHLEQMMAIFQITTQINLCTVILWYLHGIGSRTPLVPKSTDSQVPFVK